MNANESDALDHLIPDDLEGDDREECRTKLADYMEAVQEEIEAAGVVSGLESDLEALGCDMSAVNGEAGRT